MEIKCFWTTDLRTNTYLGYDPETKKGFLIDPGASASALRGQIRSLDVDVEAILLTHGHYDHIGAVAQLQRELSAKVYLHRADWDKIVDYRYLSFGEAVHVEPFTPDCALEDGQVLHLAGCPIEVMHTPGHSKGSVCFVTGDVIFCGDTLFKDSYGRYDFADGSFAELLSSVRRLFALKGDYKLLCGHEAPSDLEYERTHNPILTDAPCV